MHVRRARQFRGGGEGSGGPAVGPSRPGARGGARRWLHRPLASLPFFVLALAVVMGGLDGDRVRAETRVRDVLLNPETLADPATLIDLGATTFDAAVARFVPQELPIVVPGLDGLGPVTMDDATITIERPDDVLQIGGWKITLDDTVTFDLGGAPHAVTFSIELEWENAAGDVTPIVELNIRAPDPLTVAEILELTSLLAAGSASQETIATDTSVSNVALSFHWDHDGPAARTWFDVSGTTTFGTEDIAVTYLFSYDAGGPKGTHFITGVRVDNTDPDATTVSLGGLISGEWGAIAGNLELPEFVLAKVSGLPAGETLRRTELRLGSVQSRFFSGCDACGAELPEDFELDSTVTLLAKIDLKAFGSVVADAFDYPENDSTVDVFGKLGVTFSSIEGAAPVSLDQVALQADVPQSGGLNSLLPPWLEVGAWRLTISYDSDPLLGGVTVGAETVISADVDDDDVHDFVFDTVATFTRTNDGTISVGLAGTSNQTWNNPFGLQWLDLTSLGIGGSFTRAEGGDATAFDAALTSTFELCEPGCGAPSKGRVEVRLGITSDVQVQFRIAFGEDGTAVPIGALLGPIADQFGASPELTGEIGAMQLDDLVFAVTIDSSGSVVFESFASANLGLLGDITAYLYVEAGGSTPRFFFGARPSSGVTLGQLLAPNPDDPAPPAALETIELPTLGVVAAPVGGFAAPSAGLSPDGFEFFKPLYGCEDDATVADCSFEVALEPGVNLVANITFPDELSALASGLWLDADRGIQFQGTLSLPGVFDPGPEASVKLGLRLTLPRLDPGDAVEFIEDGSLTLGIEAELSETPRIAVFVEGELNTRWRRGNEPIDAGDTCPLTSVPLRLYEHPDATAEIFCYDRLTFSLRGEVALQATPPGLNVSLTGGLSAPNGWQHPFGAPGLEWLVINELKVKIDIQVPGTTGPSSFTINAGFLGEIEIDNGDPDLPNTVLQASFAAGVTTQPLPNPPFVSFVPNFKGVRAYVSRFGMADVALLQQTIFPGGGGLDLSSLPGVEFQNVEFMFAIASDPELCLEPRIGFAGELWIDPQRTEGGGGDVPTDETCRPFGADVDPAVCLANQELGCFASVKATIGLDGIFASGSIGEFSVGPVAWEGGLIDLRLKLGEPPIVAVSGGVVVDDLGTGRLAMKLELLPVAKVEFYGFLEAFGVFEAQVDGNLELRLDPLWPPQVQGDFALHAALRADFDAFVRNQLSVQLEALAGSLDDLDEAVELLARDPIRNLAEARDALQAAGVELPPWMDDLIDYVEFVDDNVLPPNAPLPTYDQIVNGEPYEYRTPAMRSCNWFDAYDRTTDQCRDGQGNVYAPDLYCLPLVTLDELTKTCVITIVLPDIGDFIEGVLPPSANAALEDVYQRAVAAIQDLDLVPNIAGLGIEEYLYELSDQLADARFMSIDCAEFAWVAGQGAGDVRIRLLLTVKDTQYGFDVELDLTSPGAGVKTVAQELIEFFLEFGEQDVECSGEQPVPDWLGALGGGSATPTTLTLDPAGPVDEGAQVEVRGTITPAAASPIDIELAWGDGTTTTIVDVTGDTFRATHTYADDDPTGTPSDGYAVSATTPTASGPAITTITVRNVAPAVTMTSLLVDDRFVADEGVAVDLTFEFDDVPADTHTAIVHWGDGSTTKVPTATSPVALSHIYRDDDPTATPFDDVAEGVRVVVRDDDRGVGEAIADLRVHNVAPVVTFPDAAVDLDGVVSLTVQYSDPIGGDPSTGAIASFRIVAEDTAADTLTLRSSFDGAFGTASWLDFEGPTCEPLAPVHQRCTWSVSAVPDPVSGIHTDIAPGTYDLVLTVVDDDTGSAGVTLRLTVLPEDARTWYQGPTFAATSSALSGDATIQPRATVRDVTSAVPMTDPQWDPWPGDIRNATMTFSDREAAMQQLCAAASVDEVFTPFDVFDAASSVGVGTCNWNAFVSGDASEYTVATVVGGYYTRDETDDDVVVTIARPLEDFITGGGYLVLTDSAGVYAGAAGSHANFGFHVKFNSKGTNLVGGATIIVRSEGRTYRIKSNATTSLGAGGTSAQFEAKANLVDITDEIAPVSLGGNYVLQMRMTDLETGDGQDVIGFALWDIKRTGTGKNATTTQLLLFSSNWTGQTTEVQQIAGGNLVVHSTA